MLDKRINNVYIVIRQLNKEDKMSNHQIYLITKMLNEGVISIEQAREMVEVSLEREYLRKYETPVHQKIFAY